MEEIIKTCPECGSKLYHNKGISKKTGKPYENWKCGECEYIKWVDIQNEPVLKSDAMGQEVNLINLDKKMDEAIKKLDEIIEKLPSYTD